MDSFTLSVEKLICGDKSLSRQTVTVNNGYITAIEKCQHGDSNIVQGTLLPGFIDIQVNGGGGCLFNQSPTVESIQTIAKAHQQFGTTGWLPTLITDNLEQMQNAADAVSEAIRMNVKGVLGIHFEGPHLSVEKKGVHQQQLIRNFSEAEYELYSRQDLGKIVVTLAPETVEPKLITKLVDLGVIVCLGHSNATFQQTQAALDAGATGFTHLFNAMSAMTSREPGMVGAALLDKPSYAGLILDGIHVHPEMAKLAIDTKQNIMLVTDAMPLVGSEDDNFKFFGQIISRNGNILRDNQGALAGSVLDMASAVSNGMTLADLSLEQAVNMASLNPAKFLAIDKQYGTIKVGNKASMVLIDDKEKVKSNWIDGEQVF